MNGGLLGDIHVAGGAVHSSRVLVSILRQILARLVLLSWQRTCSVVGRRKPEEDGGEHQRARYWCVK